VGGKVGFRPAFIHAGVTHLAGRTRRGISIGGDCVGRGRGGGRIHHPHGAVRRRSDAHGAAAGRLLQPLVMSFLWINILWGLINRMTVFPLDGGNVARRLLIKTDPMDGARKSLWISAVAGALLMAAGFFLFGSIFI